MSVLAAAQQAIDPALEGRELGPWFMVPAWITVPLACIAGVAIVWYFLRLGCADVPRELRWIRRISLVLVGAALIPLVRGLTFAHPHEDRSAFAIAWAMVLLLVVASLVLAVSSSVARASAAACRRARAPRKAASSPLTPFCASRAASAARSRGARMRPAAASSPASLPGRATNSP